jgi:hypothetical protein
LIKTYNSGTTWASSSFTTNKTSRTLGPGGLQVDPKSESERRGTNGKDETDGKIESDLGGLRIWENQARKKKNGWTMRESRSRDNGCAPQTGCNEEEKKNSKRRKSCKDGLKKVFRPEKGL